MSRLRVTFSIAGGAVGDSFIVLFCLLALAPITLAQEWGDGSPAANPARPTVSNPATLTPPGYLQFENGGLYANDSPEFSSQFSLNQVTKLSVTSRLEFALSSQPFARSVISPHRQVNLGDIFAGLQGVLIPGEGYRPTVSVTYIRRVYSGAAPDVDIGSFRNGVLLLISNDMGKFHVDANGIASEQGDARVRRAQFGQTLSISHPLGKITISGELWHFSQPLIRGNAVGNLWAVSYAVNRHFVLDAGFDHGWTSTSTQWEAFAGFTYLLPRRLWHGPKSQLTCSQ